MNKLLAVLLLVFVSVSAFAQSGRIPMRFSEGVKTDTIWAFSDTGFVFPYNDSLWFQKGLHSPPVNLMRMGTGGGTGDMNKSVYDTNNNGIVDTVEHAPAGGGPVLWSNVTGAQDTVDKRMRTIRYDSDADDSVDRAERSAGASRGLVSYPLRIRFERPTKPTPPSTPIDRTS
jgi:hypothetical protein